MDRQGEQHKKEAIKMTMLMQDHTLKQQIKELHRLYDVQKKLMDQLKKDSKQLPDSQNFASSTDQGQPIDRDRLSKETDVPFTLINYFDLERQAPKDDDAGKGRPSASNTVGIGNEGIDDGDDGGKEVNLALSVGLGCSKKRQE